MKEISKLYLFLLFVLIISGCTTEQPLENTDEIKIGVVETVANKNRSTIHWYDAELEEVARQKLKYASLGDIFRKPVYDAEEVYLIPEGLIGKKDAKKVISINQEDFVITEYAVPNIALKNVAVIDDYLFVNSNLNFQTHLSRVNRETKDFNEEVYDAAYFEAMLSVDDKLFLFGSMDRGLEEGIMENTLYVLDTDFNLLETLDLTDIGYGAYKFLLDDSDLYISIPLTMKDRPNSVLLKIDVYTLETELIDLEINHPDSLVKYKGQLLIAHVDIVTGEGTLVTVIDLNTKEKETIDLEMNIFYMDIYENQLIVCDDENLALFDLENNFELLKEIKIDKEDETYLSNIIIID